MAVIQTPSKFGRVILGIRATYIPNFMSLALVVSEELCPRTDRRADRHGLINSVFDPESEYIYIVIPETLPFGCYKRMDKAI